MRPPGRTYVTLMGSRDHQFTLCSSREHRSHTWRVFSATDQAASKMSARPRIENILGSWILFSHRPYVYTLHGTSKHWIIPWAISYHIIIQYYSEICFRCDWFARGGLLFFFHYLQIIIATAIPIALIVHFWSLWNWGLINSIILSRWHKTKSSFGLTVQNANSQRKRTQCINSLFRRQSVAICTPLQWLGKLTEMLQA